VNTPINVVIPIIIAGGKHWEKAVNQYTKAIELDPTKAVYYSNRAFAHIKLERLIFLSNFAVVAYFHISSS